MVRSLWVLIGLSVVGACANREPDLSSTEQAVTTCVDLVAVGDAMLSNPPMGVNFGSQPIMRVGGKDESLVQFDLSSLPSTAVVARARLGLYISGRASGTAGNGHPA